VSDLLRMGMLSKRARARATTLSMTGRMTRTMTRKQLRTVFVGRVGLFMKRMKMTMMSEGAKMKRSLRAVACRVGDSYP